MKFIESLELREWVKDKLKKKLFQNAHALAVQTGCEILVKLHDTTDISGCQYYATNNLRKIYHTSKLRQRGEMLVSGETGLPLVDKCIQYEDEPAEGGDEGAVPEDDSGGGGGENNDQMNEDFVEESEMPDISAVPMQLSTASGDAGFTTETQTTTMQTASSDIDIAHATNQSNLVTPMGTQVKQEPMFEQQQHQQQDYSSSQQQQAMMGSMPVQQGQQQQQQPQTSFASYPISPKPYQCSICRKAFKSVHVLQKHTLTFHQPGGMSMTLSRGRGRGRGSRGNKTRGRGRGSSSVFSRPTLVQQPFQPTQPPTVKDEDNQNRFTCIMCNQQFEESSQLNEHMSQCPMAPGSSSQGSLQPQDPSTTQYVQGTPISQGDQESLTFSTDGVFPQNVPPVTTTSAASWGLESSTPGGAGSADYFGQQTHSSASSTFSSPGQSPGQTPRSSTGGGTPRGFKARGVGLGQNEIMTKRNLMAAILQTGGPVATTTAVTWAYKFLRMLTRQQFEASAKDLQAISLGTLVSSPNQRGGPSLVFVKKHPSDVGEILLQNPDLCSLEFYTERFILPVSKAIGNNTVDRLVANGLVSAEQRQKPKKVNRQVAQGLASAEQRQKSQTVAQGLVSAEHRQKPQTVAQGLVSAEHRQKPQTVAQGLVSAEQRQNPKTVDQLIAQGLVSAEQRQKSQTYAQGLVSAEQRQTSQTVAHGLVSAEQRQKPQTVAQGLVSAGQRQNPKTVAQGLVSAGQRQNPKTVDQLIAQRLASAEQRQKSQTIAHGLVSAQQRPKPKTVDQLIAHGLVSAEQRQKPKTVDQLIAHGLVSAEQRQKPKTVDQLIAHGLVSAEQRQKPKTVDQLLAHGLVSSEQSQKPKTVDQLIAHGLVSAEHRQKPKT